MTRRLVVCIAPMSVRYDKLVPALKALLPDERLNFIGRAIAFIRRLREIEASRSSEAAMLAVEG